MKSKSILLLMLISTSFIFLSEAGASSDLEWRQFYQDGNQYVIMIYSPQLASLEFFWKEQEANQGAYQLFSTISKPNSGNLYQALWNISSIGDGNYTILVRSNLGPELEQNVVVNKAHWEISPVILQYQGWIDCNYVGSIEGTVDTQPVGGSLSFYSQFFLYTKQSENMFRVDSLQIPDDTLKLIYKELYSRGAKWGTLHYVINDDKLEVRVIFPGYANYRPYPEQEGGEEQQQEEQPQEQQSEEMQQILEELQKIQEKNDAITQQITNMTSSIAEKNETITNLQSDIDEVKRQSVEKEKEAEQQRQQESQKYLLYAAGIAVVGGAAAAYVFSKRQATPMQVQKPRNFVHGPPFRPSASPETSEDQIPALVLLVAQKQNLDPLELNRLMNEEKKQKPHLSTERVLNLVLNKLKEQGEI